MTTKITCEECNGKGSYVDELGCEDGEIPMTRECDNCNGRGYYLQDEDGNNDNHQ